MPTGIAAGCFGGECGIENSCQHGRLNDSRASIVRIWSQATAVLSDLKRRAPTRRREGSDGRDESTSHFIVFLDLKAGLKP